MCIPRRNSHILPPLLPKPMVASGACWPDTGVLPMCPPRGTFGHVWRHFWLSHFWGRARYWHLVGRGQNAADHCTAPRTDPGDVPTPQVSGAEVERLSDAEVKPLCQGGRLGPHACCLRAEGNREGRPSPQAACRSGGGKSKNAGGPGMSPKAASGSGRWKDKGRVFHFKSTLTYLKTNFLKHIITCLFP